METWTVWRFFIFILFLFFSLIKIYLFIYIFITSGVLTTFYAILVGWTYNAHTKKT